MLSTPLSTLHFSRYIVAMATPPFTYLNLYQVLVCTDRQCQYAVFNLSRHLRESHAISLSERKAIIVAYQDLPLVPPDQVRNPPAGGSPFPCLGKPIDGFVCIEGDCRFICTSRDSARQHANKQHYWRASKREPTHWQETKVQTFFKKRDWIQYFIVQDGDREEVEISESLLNRPRSRTSTRIILPTTTPHINLTNEQQTEADAVAREWDQIQRQHEQTMQEVEVEQATHDRTGWWSLTKWAQHFSQCNIQYLAHASRVPDSDEDLLKEACRVADLTLHRSLQGLGTLHRETRRWLRSPKLGEPDVRPLARLQEPNSQERYHNYWRRFICYCFRVWLSQQEHETGVNEAEHDDETSDSNEDDVIDDETSSSSSGDSEDAASSLDVDTMKDARRLLVFTSQQQDLMTLLHDQLQASEDEVSDEARAETMLELCKTFIFCTFTGTEFECGLVHFCAILGIDGENNRLRRPSDFTYMLAGLVYDVRLLAVEILLPSHEREEQARDSTARDHFLQQRATYLADGTSTPMSTMISLLAYGKHIAMNEGNAGMVSWSRNRQTLYYKGLPIEMAAFRSMVHGAIARATQMLWENLMWVQDESQRFDVPLEHVQDDVSFDRRGWSFMSRKENGLQEGAHWMRERLVQLEGSQRLRNETG